MRTTRIPLLTLLALPLMIGADECVPEPPDECICTADYAPVCGEDGVTYGNACEADCAMVRIAHEGECEVDPMLCFDDGDCGPGTYCNHDECLSPCDGSDGMACPAVCYGRCEPVPDPWCESDADCAAGFFCNLACEGDPAPALPCEGDGCDEPLPPSCTGTCEPEPTCVCPDVWAPVCGADGMTYGNACEAECVGVPVDHEGECRHDCICPEIYAPVCGADGITYDNACFAECSGVPIAHDGECRHDCICPDVWAPVCGEDGRTYGNECEASCVGVRIAHEGECGGCACPDVWDPICGADGRTYGNPCEARCVGVAIDYHGECRTDPPPPPGDECFSDMDCRDGARCDLSVCLPYPCEPGDACPDVCVGLCTYDGMEPPPVPEA